MNKLAIPLIVWVIVLLAFYLAVTAVPITDAHACQISGGDWNDAWGRCYGP